MKASEIKKRPLDEDAFAGLAEQFRDLSPWLRQRLRHRLGDAPEVDDVVQESFIRLARYDESSRSRHPRALLLRISGNLLTDENRRSLARGGGRHVALDADGHSPALSSPPDQHALLVTKQAILGLAEPLRAVFILARFTPMTHAEIADSLGISVKTVEWRMAKAIAMCLDEIRR